LFLISLPYLADTEAAATTAAFTARNATAAFFATLAVTLNPLATPSPTFDKAENDLPVLVDALPRLSSLFSVETNLSSSFFVLASSSTINDSVAIDYPLRNHSLVAPFCTRS